MRLKGFCVNCEVLETGPVGDAIVSYSNDQKFDLIIIATHGHGS